MTFGMPGPGRPGGPPRGGMQRLSRRSRVILPTLVVLALLLGLFGLFTNFYTELMWFRSVGFTEVFTTALSTKILLFFMFGLLMAAAVVGNLIVAYRFRPPYRALSIEQQSLDRYRVAIEPYLKLVVIGVAGLLGVLAGTSAAGEWRTWLLWRNSTPFGVTDAQFGRDVSYFAFSYPWWRFVLGFLFGVVILSLIVSAVTHYLYGGIRLQTPGDKTAAAARVHLSVLLGVFVLLKAVAYWLDRYGLAFSDRGVVTGPSYTDVNAVLPAKTILTVIAVICALLFFANVVWRGWQLPGVGLGLLVLSAILIGGVYPAIVQQFQVRPNEVDREKPYIARNIEATRYAYGLDEVVKTQYSARTTASSEQLRKDADTTASVRLLDPTILPSTYTQLQQVRGFYEFSNPLDVDRYSIDGRTRDVVAAVREVDLTGIPDTQKNWINQHLVYTHGFGFAAAPGNTRDDEGRPVFVEGGIPPTNDLASYEPRVYFGERSPSYSIVGAPKGASPREFDYPDDTTSDGQRNNTYQGGGVPVGSLFNRLLFATKFQERNILLSGALSDQSKILYVRNPKDRAAKVAPWLTLDGDPYPAVIDGRIQWILDGYTTTNGFPYSERTTIGEATADSLTTGQRAPITQVQSQVNYIRNSVKITVDAYDGTVTLYAWDKSDPVLQTWRKAFPGTVKSRDAMSQELLDHIRYPEDLFKVQRELYSRYHVTDAVAFYGGQDFWRVPEDPVRGGSAQPPYYLTLRNPGDKQPEFSLTTVFVPQRRQNLAAFMAAGSDAGEDYGRIRVLELPSDRQISGPNQVRNQFRSDPQVGRLVNILERGGSSSVQFGNLLTLPVGGGLLYVQPVYVQASGGQTYPLLRKVLVSFGDRIAFEDTLAQALDVVFQGESVGIGQPPATGEPPAPVPGQSPELRAALQDAQQAFQDGQEALQNGDFAAYGEAQQRLSDALERAIAAEQQEAREQSKSQSSPSPSPSPSPG